MTTHLLNFERVTKKYGANVALDDFSLQVQPGEVVAVLGANGAGKSTFISLASGLRSPSSGQALVFGKPATDPSSNRQRRTLPQELSFPSQLKVSEILTLVSAHYPRDESAKWIRDLEIESLLKRKTSELSGGERRKLAIVCALIGNPSMVLLDEPTANVDLLGQAQVHKLLRDYFGKNNSSLIFSSHDMREVENLAHRVVVLKKGRIVKDSPTQMIKSMGHLKKVRFVPSKPVLGFSSQVRVYFENDAVELLGTNSDDLLKEVIRVDPMARNIALCDPTLDEIIVRIWENPEQGLRTG